MTKLSLRAFMPPLDRSGKGPRAASSYRGARRRMAKLFYRMHKRGQLTSK